MRLVFLWIIFFVFASLCIMKSFFKRGGKSKNPANKILSWLAYLLTYVCIDIFGVSLQLNTRDEYTNRELSLV